MMGMERREGSCMECWKEEMGSMVGRVLEMGGGRVCLGEGYGGWKGNGEWEMVEIGGE